MKNFGKHLSHYLPLLGIFSLGVAGFVFFDYDRFFQMALAVAVAASYVVWGLIHHYLHRDLHLSVVIEYLIIACLGVVIVFSLIYR